MTFLITSLMENNDLITFSSTSHNAIRKEKHSFICSFSFKLLSFPKWRILANHIFVKPILHYICKKKKKKKKKKKGTPPARPYAASDTVPTSPIPRPLLYLQGSQMLAVSLLRPSPCHYLMTSPPSLHPGTRIEYFRSPLSRVTHPRKQGNVCKRPIYRRKWCCLILISCFPQLKTPLIHRQFTVLLFITLLPTCVECWRMYYGPGPLKSTGRHSLFLN